MPLAIDPAVLVTLVVSGVTGVVLGTVALGWNKQATLTEQAVVERFRIDLGDDVAVRDVVLADDGRAALVSLDEGPGLACVLGDRIVTRPLGGTVRRVADQGGALRVTFRDVGLAPVLVRLGDPDLRARWAERLRRVA